MLEGFEIINKPNKTKRFIFRGTEGEVVVTEKLLIEKAHKEALGLISKSIIDNKLKNEIANKIKFVNENYTGKQKAKALLEINTTDYQKKIRTLVKNRLVSEKQKEIGASKFLDYINNIMEKLNKIYEAYNG